MPAHVQEKQYARITTKNLLEYCQVCVDFLKDLMFSFDALQKNYVRLSQQTKILEELLIKLREIFRTSLYILSLYLHLFSMLPVVEMTARWASSQSYATV